MNLRGFIFTAIAALVVVHSEVNYIDHDQVEPFAQPEPKTNSEKAAVKYKPQLYVSYGCHPYLAVQADGSVSAGLKGSGPADRECEGSTLVSQVYSRSDWYKNKWAIMPRLRFTELDGESQDLITWEQLTDEARDALSNAKFNSWVFKKLRREMPLKDGVFEKRIEDAWPFE
ncbi:hypothetical protein PC123_g11869 [Phytophthora cactorum]|nr:hypothetical protein PC120_g4115 [Phytophthora cactorum]KAG4052983.1 hypothetical protein PC123_g11869 [Phytophthora cactorum]